MKRIRILLGARALMLLLILAGPAAAAQAAEEWRPLIEADSIGEWSVEGETVAGESRADFRFEDGVVIGQPVGHNPRNSFLCSPAEHGDFELTFSFRIEPTTLNSGLQFRSHVGEDGIVAGPQLEMEVMAPGEEQFVKRWIYPVLVRFSGHPWRPRFWATGGVYGESLESGWIYPGVAGGDNDAFREQGERLTNPGGWNELRLEAIGPRVRTWLAGELRADYVDETNQQPGLICLQVHGGEYRDPSLYRVEWKDLRIRRASAPL
jgi:hypothetical protein